ncbi:MAG: SseB family protein [Mycobacteriales bacterium]
MPDDQSPAAADGVPDEPNAPEFQPANPLEQTLLRCVFNGARATLLRALARSALCIVADPPPELGLTSAAAGQVRLPCVVDSEGRHALIYTSYRQLALANRLPADSPWFEVPAADLFGKWPPGVDVWLNAGGEMGLPLPAADIATIADIAAGLEVDEAYEIGPDDDFSDFPGPAVPDRVDCAIVVALFDLPMVLEVVRMFRKLEEPAGRTWRIVLVLIDSDNPAGAPTEELAQTAVTAVNEASDECCELHVADVHDDEVYDAIAHIVAIGVPLWRREGMGVPDTLEGLDEL